jgi:hypothetical protein
MIRFRSLLWMTSVLILSIVLTVGCGGDGEETSEPQTNQPPTIEITAPADGSILPAGQAVIVSIIAEDDQAVARIELYVDSSLIESRVTPTGSAYTTVSEAFTWSASIIGSHALQARAYDGEGLMGASRILGVEVVLPGTTPISPALSPTPDASLPPTGDTPIPPPATEPAPAATAETALVTSNVNANVRSGPGTNYPAVGGLAEGASAPVTGRNADSSWWQINYQGSAAWIANSVVTANSAAFNAPVASAPPPPPPPTSTPLPPTATPAPVVPTNPPAPATGLRADQTNLSAGQCTTLHWDFPTVKAFYVSLGFGYDKEGKPGTGSHLVCPSVTTEYKTTVVNQDSSQQFPSLTINVGGSGCGDPVVQRFVPTTDSVGAGVPFSIFWDVECAKTVRFIREGSSAEPVGGHAQKIDVTINKDTLFTLRVEKSNGDTHNASFTVRVK